MLRRDSLPYALGFFWGQSALGLSLLSDKNMGAIRMGKQGRAVQAGMLALALGLLLGLGACSKRPANAQQALVENFYAAVASADVQQALGYWQLESSSPAEALLQQGTVQMLVAMRQETIQANGGLAAVKLLRKDVEQQQAQEQVQAQLQFKNGHSLVEDLQLIRLGEGEEQVWKMRL